MTTWIAAGLLGVAGICLGLMFCKAYHETKDAGYIQTDYEEDEDDHV